MFLFGDHFDDAGGDGGHAGSEVGGGDVLGLHGVLAGEEVDVFGGEGFEVGVDGGGLVEERQAGAVGDEFDLGGALGHGFKEVAHVDEGHVPVGFVGGGEDEEDAVGFGESGGLGLILGEGGRGWQEQCEAQEYEILPALHVSVIQV